MLLDKFQYLPGDDAVGTDLTIIHFPLAQLFHLRILGWHDAHSGLRRLAEIRTIECNRRHRPTPQALAGLLAQPLEEPIFHHIAFLSDASVTIDAGASVRYSITSSARERSVVGTSRPSAFAVLRLISSSNRVGGAPPSQSPYSTPAVALLAYQRIAPGWNGSKVLRVKLAGTVSAAAWLACISSSLPEKTASAIA